MDQRQAFAHMQNLMGISEGNGDFLGDLVIFSAVLTEFALTDILFAEADKIRAAICLPDVTADQLASVDTSVSQVLEQICCIEKRVIGKIDRGIELRNYEEVEEGPC
ncbi:hypothetical protein [Sporosarcina sp. 6E9]|uniref:hypothetical protein n=1 Tax=Sporosarcina sp. 6E9 TaxID=2819235 RepID=UPI001B313929|nr:hypothetical protein [Sporosarcina sp. 6E9]